VVSRIAAAVVGGLLGGPGCLVQDAEWLGPADTEQASDGSGDGPTSGTPDDDDDDDDDADGGGDGGGGSRIPSDSLPADCVALPALPDDAIVVGPQDNAMLATIVAQAPAGATIALQPGTYDRSSTGPITITNAGVTLRGASGEPLDVVLDGGRASGDNLLWIAADDALVADLTLTSTGSGGGLIGIEPTDVTINRPRFYRLALRDTPNAAIDVRPSLSDTPAWTDEGVIACSNFELTPSYRETLTDCTSVGAVRARGSNDWIIRDNTIEGHWCPGSPAYAVIAFDNASRNTVVMRNRILNVFRGILLGGDTPFSPRPWDDTPCGPSLAEFWGHIGGLVVNNVIYVGDPEMAVADPTYPADSMISFWRVCGGAALHNTVINEVELFNSIEWRYAETSVTVANNLVTTDLMARDGAFAFGVGLNGVGIALSEFADAAALDFHLAPTSTAIDAGYLVPGLFIDSDIDRRPRDGFVDLGADEWE